MFVYRSCDTSNLQHQCIIAAFQTFQKIKEINDEVAAVAAGQKQPNVPSRKSPRPARHAGFFSSASLLFPNILTLILEPLMPAERHVCALRRDAGAARTAQQGLRLLKPDLEIGLVSVGRRRVYSLSSFY